MYAGIEASAKALIADALLSSEVHQQILGGAVHPTAH